MNIIEILSQKIEQNREKINQFFVDKFEKTPPLFYNSVDLRHNGVKLAPVDTNCFPAGFNNLGNESRQLAEKIADDYLNKNFPGAKKILILPENHTRNIRYLQNLKDLSEILSKHREVRIGSLISEITAPTNFDLENGSFITLYPFAATDFSADVIILNNDLTDGIPEALRDVKTPIIPSIKMGWHARTKSHHFDIYNQLAVELATILEIDPWLISSKQRACGDIDFKEPDKELGGIKCLAKSVDKLLEELREKYKEYGISDEPYCYIKADNGTYGIAVWPVFSSTDVLEMNKKERNKMNMLKGSVQTQRVLVQEGIKTVDRIDGKIAEPMIYMIGGEVVGNLFRVNEARDEKISLNAAGAEFFDLRNLEENQLTLGISKEKITSVYSLIARLAALASSIENSQL